jgi:hypothetical protein
MSLWTKLKFQYLFIEIIFIEKNQTSSHLRLIDGEAVCIC